MSDSYSGVTHRARYPSILDEAVLRTACGCEKIVFVPAEARIHQQVIGGPTYPIREGDGGTLPHPQKYWLRRFIFDWEYDTAGRRVFLERVDEGMMEDWRAKYQQLYNEVYGMDKGL